MIAFLILCAASAAGAAELPNDSLKRAEALVAKGALAEAESEYRRALEENPRSRAARIGLARVRMWRLDVAEADARFREVLRDDPRDLDALEGIATIAYWRGDHASALRALREVLREDSRRETARALLQSIEKDLEPHHRVEASLLDDDQPLQRVTLRARSAWTHRDAIRLEAATAVESFDRGGDRLTAYAVEIGASRWVAPLGARLTVALEPMRFPNGARELLGSVSLRRRLIPLHSTVAISVRRDDILATAAAVDREATAMAATLSWSMERSNGWLAGARLEGLRYFDDNDGMGADTFVLAPLARTEAIRAWGGISATYRDTDESRFRLARFRAEPRPVGGFRYVYEGVYDPYWSPHELREARAVLAGEFRRGGWLAKVHLDGGTARDEAVAFGPPSGTSPLPPGVVPQRLPRSFRPWRASASIIKTLGHLDAEMAFERHVTVFYTSNEYRASLAGRF